MTRVSKARVLVVEADADYRAVIARCVELAEGTELASRQGRGYALVVPEEGGGLP